jgi:hypothetical protein
MANEATKIGTIEIGLPSGITITSLVRESTDHETTGEIEYGKDENNNDAFAIVSNLGNRYTIVAKLAAAVSVKKGDVVTVNGAKYLCEVANTSKTTSFTRLNFTIYKPDAMVFPT